MRREDLEYPVRLAAVFLFGPLLIWRGYIHMDFWILSFGMGLMVVDGTFLLIPRCGCYEPVSTEAPV